MSTYIAAIGGKALWFTYLWLASAIGASYVSDRKGYGEKTGLAVGLITSLVGFIILLVWPAKSDSRWKLQGPVGNKGKTVAEMRAEQGV